MRRPKPVRTDFATPWRPENRCVTQMIAFDYDNPWHRYVNLYFCIACESCETEIPLGDLVGDDRECEFEVQCVLLSEMAISRGWKPLPDGWSFHCPTCAAQPDCA